MEKLVAPPAGERTVGFYRARVIIARANLREGAAWGRGLASGVVSPAEHRPFPEDPASVLSWGGLGSTS